MSSLAPFSFVPPRLTQHGPCTLVVDCRAGVAGDMFTAALLHLLDELWAEEPGGQERAAACRSAWRDALESLQLDDVAIEVADVQKCGIGAKKLSVTHREHHPHRGLSDVLSILNRGALSAGALEKATAIFRALAEAEAAVHQTTVENVHFHEVGAVDAIIDIASAAILLDAFGPAKVIASPVRTGFGHVACAHGKMPVPAPATARLLRGIPTFAGDVEKELATPTGAAILRTCVDHFGSAPAGQTWAEGYGAGERDTPHANVVRATLQTAVEGQSVLAHDATWEEIVVIETHIDDMTGEDFGALTERLLSDGGAVDVSCVAATGKKGRPMTWVRVLCPVIHRAKTIDTLLTHSTTLGVRVRTDERCVRVRDAIEVQTPFGVISGKRVRDPNGHERFFPEADDCAAAARQASVSVADVRVAAAAAFAQAGDPAS